MNLALSGNGKEATWAVSLGNWYDLETRPHWVFYFPSSVWGSFRFGRILEELLVDSDY